MHAVFDYSKLLADIPKGAWVAVSKDEEKVVVYAAELQEVIQRAKEAGEDDPIIMRVPESDCLTLFL